MRVRVRVTAKTPSGDPCHSLVSGHTPVVQEPNEHDQPMDIDSGLSERAQGKLRALPTPLHTPKPSVKKDKVKMNLYVGNTDSGSEVGSDTEIIPAPNRFKRRGKRFQGTITFADRIRYSTPVPDSSIGIAGPLLSASSVRASSPVHHNHISTLAEDTSVLPYPDTHIVDLRGPSPPVVQPGYFTTAAGPSRISVSSNIQPPVAGLAGLLRNGEPSGTQPPAAGPSRTSANIADLRRPSPPVAQPGYFTTAAGPSRIGGPSNVQLPAVGPLHNGGSSSIQPPTVGPLSNGEPSGTPPPATGPSHTSGSSNASDSTRPASVSTTSSLNVAPVNPNDELNNRLHLLEEKVDRLTSALEESPTAQVSQPFEGQRPPTTNKASRKRPVKVNNLLRDVRKEQQRMFGISQDADILLAVQRGHIADSKHVEAFNLGRHGGPSLQPLKPYWDDYKSMWNQRLADMFAIHFCAQMPGYEECKEQIADHFINRIQTLQRTLNGRLPKTENEDLAEVEANYREAQELTLHNKRVRIRLISLYSSRLAFTEVLKNDGNDLGLSLYKLVCALGHEGQSDDESGDDTDFTPTEQYWRDPFVGRLLRYIDECRKDKKTEHGRRIPGAPPRTRTRSLNPTRSTRQPPRGLPINLYNTNWYTSLGEGSPAQLSLHANPTPLELPKDKNARNSAR